MRKLTLIGALLGVVVVLSLMASKDEVKPTPTATLKGKTTRTPTTTTLTPTTTRTPTPTVAVSATATATLTASPTAGVPTVPPGGVVAYPGAPLCPDSNGVHDTSIFHTLWDGVRGCHYDHEHGDNPFTADRLAAFPGFDLRALIGGVGVGHTNPSSPIENTMKHGGFKWDVVLDVPGPCQAGFEGATYCVEAAAIQFHDFGDARMELEGSIHSSVALLKVCNPASPSDCGYLFTNQLQEYGQRVSPYQGTLLPYPNTFLPSYDTPRGPYWSADCAYTGIPGCRPDIPFILSHNANVNSTVTGKRTGSGARPQTSSIFRLLFRVRDGYQVLDSRDLVHPFTWPFVCSYNGGVDYNPTQCRYNNSTANVHEVAGTIPSAWDNLAGFDTDPRPGRITADGFTTRFGQRNADCTEPGLDCHPIKMVGMFVGVYGDILIDDKINQFTPAAQPERDVYFCAGQVCLETSPGAVPSGWIGPGN
jgi:hypothetical protein